MERHVKVFRAHRALSWLYGGLAAVFLVLMLIPGSRAPTDAMIGGVIVMGCFFAVHHFTARGALAKNGGARVASFIIGLLMLAAFPLGTLIGGYLMWNSNGWDTDDKGVPTRPQRQMPTL